MEMLQSEMVRHMLEAADARRYSVLFNQTFHWAEFDRWCRESGEASRIIARASERIETFCLDSEAHIYYIAMSLETLETVVKSLAEAYEDEVLDQLLQR